MLDPNSLEARVIQLEHELFELTQRIDKVAEELKEIRDRTYD
jgi:hypothetical protein